MDLDSGEASRVVRGASDAMVHEGSTILYQTEHDQGTFTAKLVAQRFDLDKRQVSGPPVDIHPTTGSNTYGISGDDTFLISLFSAIPGIICWIKVGCHMITKCTS